MLSAQNQAPSALQDASDIRLLHLKSLEMYDPEFFDAFYIRQRENKPSVSPFSQQLNYHQRSSKIQLSEQQIKKIKLISKNIRAITDQEVKTKLLKIFEPNEKYQNNPHSHLSAIRKQLQEIAEVLLSSSEENKKHFGVLIKLLFNFD